MEPRAAQVESEEALRLYGGGVLGSWKKYMFVQTIRITKFFTQKLSNTAKYLKFARAVCDFLQSPSATLDHYDENLSTKDMNDYINQIRYIT